jgi:hypothetical protein
MQMACYWGCRLRWGDLRRRSWGKGLELRERKWRVNGRDGEVESYWIRKTRKTKLSWVWWVELVARTWQTAKNVYGSFVRKVKHKKKQFENLEVDGRALWNGCYKAAFLGCARYQFDPAYSKSSSCVQYGTGFSNYKT